MDNLKKAFNAARSFNEHSMEDACNELNVSRTFMNNFFKGTATSAKLEKNIRKYITKAGVVKSIQDLGLDPKQPAKNLQPANS